MNVKKYVKSIKDLGANTIAFALGIVIQQLLVMPVLAKYASEESFAEIVVFHSIFNILCAVFGDELGNAKIIRSQAYEENGLKGDFGRILCVSLGIVVIGTNICFFIFSISYFDVVICSVLFVLGIIRYYGMAVYRLKQQFNRVLLINVCYCIGEIVGLVVALFYQFYFGVFLFGEVFVLICWLQIRRKSGERIDRRSFVKTTEMKKTMKVYGEVAGVAVISNGVIYLDRLLVYPLAGAAAMNRYYGASSMSKMLSLVVNPLSSFLLAKLVGAKEKLGDKFVKKSIRVFCPLLTVLIFGSIFVTYIGVKLFYPQYFQTAVELLIPIGVTTALALAVSLLKPIIMIFLDTKKLLCIQVLYVFVLIICIYFFSSEWGVDGFAWATCIGRVVQVLACFLLLRINERRQKVKKC